MLCWEQAVPYALLVPFLQITFPGILFELGQFGLSEGDRGRWKSLVYGLFAHKSGRKWGKVTGMERSVGGAAPGVCGGFN